MSINPDCVPEIGDFVVYDYNETDGSPIQYEITNVKVYSSGTITVQLRGISGEFLLRVFQDLIKTPIISFWK